jgi:hypothetical protein
MSRKQLYAENFAAPNERYPKLDFPFANDALGAARWHIDD